MGHPTKLVPGGGGQPLRSGCIQTSLIAAAVMLRLTVAAQIPADPAAALPFITLHHTSTPSATIARKGHTAETVTFPGSTTFGWNEVQALVGGDLTNQDHTGFTLRIDPGRYTFTSQLVISNSMNFDGGNPAACIFEYAGPVDFCRMNDLTNMIVLSSGEAGMNESLLSFRTSAVMVPGEDGNNINCLLKNFSLVTKTNMFCAGIGNICGDHTLLQNVWVGGPQLFDGMNAHSGWVTLADIPEPSKMVGFVIGANQPVLRDCCALALADGIVALGDVYVTIDHFNGVCCGNYRLRDGRSAFPATSELSLGAAIMIPAASHVENMVVGGNSLSYRCWLRFYAGNMAPTTFYDFLDQFSHYSGLATRWGAAAPLTSLGAFSPIPLVAITNGPTGFGVDPDLQVETAPRPLKLFGTLISFGNWWSQQPADLIGGLGFSLVGCLGGLIGWLASKGRAKPFVLAAIKYILVLGMLLTLAGLVAAMLNQPTTIWYALLFPGVILVLVFSLSLPAIQRCYDKPEAAE